MEALKLIEHGCTLNHPSAQMVEVITDLLARQWNVQFSHTHKENNLVADKLASLGLEMDPELQ